MSAEGTTGRDQAEALMGAMFGAGDDLSPSDFEALQPFESDAIQALTAVLGSVTGHDYDVVKVEFFAARKPELRDLISPHDLVTEFNTLAPLPQKHFLVLEKKAVLSIAGMLMGATFDHNGEPVSEIQRSAVMELLGRIVGALGMSLSQRLGMTVETTALVSIHNGVDGIASVYPDKFAYACYHLAAPDQPTWLFYHLFTAEFARMVIASVSAAQGEAAPEAAADAKADAALELPALPTVAKGEVDGPPHEAPYVEMILNHPITLTAHIGQSKMTVGEVLDLSFGSKVVLDKTPGQPVDLLVAGKRVASGELLKAGDKLVVRITSVVPQDERLSALG
jgi:flagellar motor switch protein FliN/FliY